MRQPLEAGSGALLAVAMRLALVVALPLAEGELQLAGRVLPRRPFYLVPALLVVVVLVNAQFWRAPWPVLAVLFFVVRPPHLRDLKNRLRRTLLLVVIGVVVRPPRSSCPMELPMVYHVLRSVRALWPAVAALLVAVWPLLVPVGLVALVVSKRGERQLVRLEAALLKHLGARMPAVGPLLHHPLRYPMVAVPFEPSQPRVNRFLTLLPLQLPRVRPAVLPLVRVVPPPPHLLLTNLVRLRPPLMHVRLGLLLAPPFGQAFAPLLVRVEPRGQDDRLVASRVQLKGLHLKGALLHLALYLRPLLALLLLRGQHGTPLSVALLLLALVRLLQAPGVAVALRVAKEAQPRPKPHYRPCLPRRPLRRLRPLQ